MLPSALRGLAAAAACAGRRARLTGAAGRPGAWAPPAPAPAPASTSGRPAWAAAARFSSAAPRPPPPPRPPRRPPRGAARSSEQGLYLAALVVGMVGATYGAVPLYR